MVIFLHSIKFGPRELPGGLHLYNIYLESGGDRNSVIGRIDTGFWHRRYYVSTVGRNRRAIEEYIKNQLQEAYTDDQLSIKEFVDSFTGEPVRGCKQTKAPLGAAQENCAVGRLFNELYAQPGSCPKGE